MKTIIGYILKTLWSEYAISRQNSGIGIKEFLSKKSQTWIRRGMWGLAIVTILLIFFISWLIPQLWGILQGGFDSLRSLIQAPYQTLQTFDTKQLDAMQKAVVVQVIDGDTFQVRIGEEKRTIRLIGIDTPEISGPYTKEECFGPEASEYTKKHLLVGSLMHIQSDPSQGNTDPQGRLLRYAYVDQKKTLNEIIVREGFGIEHTYAAPYQLQSNFRQAQQYAKDNKIGLWGTCKNMTIMSKFHSQSV